jgi:hypothetical protein
MRTKKSKAQIDKMLWDHYAGAVSLAGTYHGRRAVCLFYCHNCENWFWQNIWSLQNKLRTRCECNYDRKQEPSPQFHNTYGHRCLPEWECYDRDVPPRLTEEP